MVGNVGIEVSSGPRLTDKTRHCLRLGPVKALHSAIIPDSYQYLLPSGAVAYKPRPAHFHPDTMNFTHRCTRQQKYVHTVQEVFSAIYHTGCYILKYSGSAMVEGYI